MHIAYLILAHQHPHLVARLVRLLLASGGTVAVHYDLNAGDQPLQNLKSQLGDLADRVLWTKRTRVAWGEWSIAEATLNGLEAIAQAGRSVAYVHLMSGADYPIRPLREFAAHLDRSSGTEFIEAVDVRKTRWVRIGPEHERYIYRHDFNWRSRPRLAQAYWKLQRSLRLKRRFPRGLAPHMGSQWWTLTWPTCERILAAGRDPRLQSFFRKVAIPDEIFFQTIVAGHVPRHRIAASGLTFSQFTDYGVPVVYYDDHVDYLARQPFYFARKISPHAMALRDAMDAANCGERRLPPLSPALIAVKGNEYETVRLSRRQTTAGRRIIGYMPDRELGDLAVARPFLAVLGASREELSFIQRLVAASGAAVCHGALFAPDSIAFIGGLERYAGYAYTDIALRDHSRTTFLADVLRKSGRIPSGVLLPWGMDGGVPALLPRLEAAHVLVVRGNVLRAFLARRPVTTTEPMTIDEGEFAGFLQVLRTYHAALPNPPGNAERTEISLTGPDWLDGLNDTLAALADASGVDRPDPIAPELAAAAAAGMSDPAGCILNAADLVSTLVDPIQRRGHLAVLGQRQPRVVARTRSPASGTTIVKTRRLAAAAE